jgi:CheY-like chemotaxis protein
MPSILIVDDRASNRELLRTTLEHAGYEVREAADGMIALAMMRQSAPDLVIMDIQMPKLDGYGVLAQMRQDPAIADIPVLALTAYAMEGDSERGAAAGFQAYITKPVALRHLLKFVAENLAA